MKKLLVAIDFSEAARYAYQYAAYLSLKLNFKLVALHVYPESIVEETLSRANIQRLQNQQKLFLKEKLQKFTTNYPDSSDEKITATFVNPNLIRSGKAGEEIVKVSQEIEADLIIIGTKDKHSIREQLFGSTTSELIQKSTVPIMIIPERAIFNSIKRIAFATDITLEKKTPFASINALAQAFEAKIDHFFVEIDKKEQLKLKEEVINTSWGAGENVNTITLIRERTIQEGIKYFLEKHPAEILALFVPHRGYLQQLFHRSLSRQIAYQTKIPLLICK